MPADSRLAIGFLSVFALPPVELVDLAADLGCPHISTVVQGQPLVPLDFGPYSLRDDAALRRDVLAALTRVIRSYAEDMLEKVGAR